MRRSQSIDGRASIAGRPLRVKNDNGGGNAGSSKIPKPRASSGNRLSSGVGSSGNSRPSFGFGSSGNSRPSFGFSNIGASGRSVGGTSGGQRSRVKSRLSGDATKNRLHYGGGHSEQMKDPRPIMDRAYKERCVRGLIEFLTQQKYPYQMSGKMLHSPAKKDFTRIFEFLVGHFCPKYQCGLKIEEEIPALMRSFGYPFTISKSHMFTVGSPHAWPHLLAALSWLRERIEVGFNSDLDRLLFPVVEAEDGGFDKVPESKIVFQHVEQCYREFMGGSDSFTHLQDEFERKIRDNIPGESLEDLVERNNRLREELNRLEDQPDELRSQQKILDNLRTDVDKLKDYHANLDSHKQQQVLKLRNVEEELEQTRLELKQVSAENLRKEKIRDTQEFSPADILRINEGRQQLQRSINALQTELDDIDKKTWHIEMDIGKEHDKCEQKCREYNEIGYDLKMIPINAENAFGVDYQLTPHTVQQKCATIIKPALVRVLKQCEEKLAESIERKLGEEEALEQLVDMQQEVTDTIRRLEAQHKRLMDTYEANKEKNQLEYEQKQMEIDTLEQELALLRKPAGMAIHEAKKTIKEETTIYEKLRKDREENLKLYTEFIMKALTMALDHKAAIQNGALALQKSAEAKLAKLQAFANREDTGS